MTFDPGKRLVDANELLHRQVHPTFIRDGRVSSQAFAPTVKDKGGLSVSRDARASAEDAYRRHTERRGLKSAGVWSVTVGECDSLERGAYSDELSDDDAHALVDFSGLSNKQVRDCADRLADLARKRGRLYPPA